ncbi:hydrolase [Leucobacter chromiireducens]|uniref:Amidohydrolase n=1 Tax=Leucobacter chromiireducens subsp. solipictus TaxID=398235 RepID=A0ABS1SJA1_9MICO|nr:hydrolase [Leucobacter chromiireducens]MBL3679559.1 amidohydrolase [Leucobacter chromiireducens subsp. solipictus]
MSTVWFRDRDGEIRRGTVSAAADGQWRLTAAAPDQRGTADAPFHGVVVGQFTDWHVHLQLVDAGDLAAGVLGRVLDLGAHPERVVAHRAAPPRGVRVEFAGAFLTAPGGYPSDRDWAPAGSFRELADAADASAAVAEMAAHGASVIKVASNADAGPVLSDELFRAVVAAAESAGLPVVAHAEGAGEATRVRRLGAKMLAHTPFTERLEPAELRAHADTMTWISTLDVHGWGAGGAAFETARENLAGFHALGGEVRYGTDLGNGPLPVGLNPRELAALAGAGLTPRDMLTALTPADPELPDTRLVFVPGPDTARLDVAAARPLAAPDLVPSGSPAGPPAGSPLGSVPRASAADGHTPTDGTDPTGGTGPTEPTDPTDPTRPAAKEQR